MMTPQLSLKPCTHFAAIRVAVWYHEIRDSTGTTNGTEMLRFTKICLLWPASSSGCGRESWSQAVFKPSKREDFTLTSCVRFAIFRRAETIPPPLTEILTHLQAQIQRESRKRHRIQGERCWVRLLSTMGPVRGVLTRSWTPATVRLAWRSEYVSRWMPSLVSPFP